MSDLYKHEKSDRVKWALTLVAFIIVAIMLAGIICGWFESRQALPEDKPKTVEEITKTPPALDEYGEVISGAAVPMPRAITFRTATSLADSATLAENYASVTLTATVKPDSASDKSVDWTIAFVNPSSEWAKGRTVTDYVTVTPSSDGATTARVKCLQPFGEQIKITVTSRMNTEAMASCTVDFAARPAALLVSGIGILNNVPLPSGTIFQGSTDIITIDPLVANSSYLSADGKYLVTSTPAVSVFGAQTGVTAHTCGEVVINSFKVEGRPSGGLVAALNAQGLASESTYRPMYITTPEKAKISATLLSCFIACGMDTSGDGSENVAAVNKLNAAILSNTSSDYDFDVRLTLETNTGTYEFCNKYKFDRSASVFCVESIELNDRDVLI